MKKTYMSVEKKLYLHVDQSTGYLDAKESFAH